MRDLAATWRCRIRRTWTLRSGRCRSSADCFTVIAGKGSPREDTELFRSLYNSLLKETDVADRYFILKDFKAYAEAQKRVEAAYRDEKNWAKSAILNVACSGKFTSDRTIQEYVDDIWHLDKVVIPEKKAAPAAGFLGKKK